MTDPTAVDLDHMTEALLTTWHDRVEAGIQADPAAHCAALAAVALALLPPPPAPDDTRLPPYSGETTACSKCGHQEAITRYRAAGEPGSRDPNTYRRRAERLERECWRCDWVWDEALAPPTGPAPHDITPAILARVLEGAHDGWALDLSPECAEHMARHLLARLSIRWRHPMPADDDLHETDPAAPIAAHTLTNPATERASQ